MLATGGAWLTDDTHTESNGLYSVEGLSARAVPPVQPASADTTNQPSVRILLVHYPAQVDELDTREYDLILAGHSHGGQVRLPFYGAVLLPYRVGPYEAGRYDTPSGPLYVNVGLGTFYFDIRFLCRPELTLIEL